MCVHAHVSVESSTSEPIVSTSQGVGITGMYMATGSFLCSYWGFELRAKGLHSKHFNSLSHHLSWHHNRNPTRTKANTLSNLGSSLSKAPPGVFPK